MRHDRNWQCYQNLNPRTYAGQYVVIVRGHLIGAGKNLQTLLRLARQLQPSEVPFVARMRDPRRLCVYSSR